MCWQKVVLYAEGIEEGAFFVSLSLLLQSSFLSANLRFVCVCSVKIGVVLIKVWSVMWKNYLSQKSNNFTAKKTDEFFFLSYPFPCYVNK